MSVDTPPTRLRDIPLYTNPHIRMCAVITAMERTWGQPALASIAQRYGELGWQSGRSMIEAGLIRAEASMDEYRAMTEELCRINGLTNYSWLEYGPDRYVKLQRSCAEYTAAYRMLDAPAQICSLPFDWDNGVLDAINPGLHVGPTSCVYQGAGECHYALEARDPDRAARAAGAYAVGRKADLGTSGREGSAAGLDRAPGWTHPQVGLYALIGAALDSQDPDIVAQVLGSQLYALGRRAAEHVRDVGLVGEKAGLADLTELTRDAFQVGGYGDARVVQGGGRLAVSASQPYAAAFQFFPIPSRAVAIALEWDRGLYSGLGLSSVRLVSAGLTDGTWFEVEISAGAPDLQAT